MLLSEDHIALHGPLDGPGGPLGPPQQPPAAMALPPEAAPQLHRLREALARYRARSAPADLEGGFAAATAIVIALNGPQGSARADLEEMRALSRALPEFGELLSSAAGEAQRLVFVGTAELWGALGLRSAAPAWTSAEWETARMVFACACTPAAQTNPARLQAGLRSLAAARFAELLGQELADSEEAWTRALAGRYDSVRHRCAPRTTRRSRGLSELLQSDEHAREAVVAGLERWLATGARLGVLADVLEAAVVHARTPARLA
jgi:hypothetical protein